MEQLLGEIDDGKRCLKAIQSSRVFFAISLILHTIFSPWLVFFCFLNLKSSCFQDVSWECIFEEMRSAYFFFFSKGMKICKWIFWNWRLRRKDDFKHFSSRRILKESICKLGQLILNLKFRLFFLIGYSWSYELSNILTIFQIFLEMNY